MKRKMGYAGIGIGMALAGWCQAAPEGRVLKLDLQPGKERVSILISHSGEGKFRLFKSEKQSSLIVEAENLSLPPNLTKLIDVSNGDGPVIQMTPYNSQHAGHAMAKLVIQLRGTTEVTGTDIPGKYLLEIKRKANAGLPASAKAGAKAADELKNRMSATKKGEETARKLIEVLSSPPEDKRYFGEKVTFEAKDAEIPDIFRLVGESSDLNIIWDPDVEGQKTSLAVRELPWDQLLDIVITQKNFKATIMGNVVRIMSVDTFNKQAEAKKRELTLSEELEPVIMSVIPLGFVQADETKKMIDTLIQERNQPGGGPAPQARAGEEGSVRLSQEFKRGRIEVDIRTNSLIVTNTKDVIERIRRLIKELDVPIPQVLIDSKILIASESFAKSIGMSWGTKVRSTSQKAGLLNAFNGIGLGLRDDSSDYTVSAPGAGFQGGFKIGTTDDANLRATLSLSEITGQTKTVASPRIIVNNNKPASIVDGQSITIAGQVVGSTVSAPTTVSPKLQLSVTPQVTSAGSVQMKSLSISKDSLTGSGGGQISTDQKQLTTDVLVDSGATLVLGGIYQMSTKLDQAGIPVLKDLPFIGQLFRTDSSSNSNSELMVFITPQIIDPQASSQAL